MVYFTPVFSRVPILLYINVGVISGSSQCMDPLSLKQVGGIPRGETALENRLHEMTEKVRFLDSWM